jgi:hypothetical protein
LEPGRGITDTLVVADGVMAVMAAASTAAQVTIADSTGAQGMAIADMLAAGVRHSMGVQRAGTTVRHEVVATQADSMVAAGSTAAVAGRTEAAGIGNRRS